MDSFLFVNGGITQVCFLYKENYRIYLFIVFDFVLALKWWFCFLVCLQVCLPFFSFFRFFPAFCFAYSFFSFSVFVYARAEYYNVSVFSSRVLRL